MEYKHQIMQIVLLTSLSKPFYFNLSFSETSNPKPIRDAEDTNLILSKKYNLRHNGVFVIFQPYTPHVAYSHLL